METQNEIKTVTYIAKPVDNRCHWWSMLLPDTGLELSGERLAVPYLKKGADLELKKGQMLIDSEAVHHRKNRGYNVSLLVCDGETVRKIYPELKHKTYIKEHGGQDLMHESGDVAACVRLAVWLRRQPDLVSALNEIESI